MADGVPVLVSDRGGLPELAGTTSVVAAGDVSAWGAALGGLWRDPAARARAGSEALQRARERLSEDAYYERLLEIYQ
jgi:glycosyltransferase involved in cell wall biosynthesis